jgi:VIT1/CCC1 family predicted Fe2+/Mn2+ transporter
MRAMTAKHLDPGSWLGELLFGLIMTLTFTLGAGIVIEEEGREGVRSMLFAILGCNLAWGIIDGVLYVLGRVFERGRLRRVAMTARATGNDAEARSLIAGELDELLAPVTAEPARQNLYAAMLEGVRERTLTPNRITAEDVRGGVAAGWLVFACSFPAVLPFLFLDDLYVALRISNAILIGLLFLAGYQQAQRHTLARPWIAGLLLMLVGVFLVAIAIPLGG